MKPSVLQEKSFQFALFIIRIYKELTETKCEYIISKQLLRSGTSIGANIREGARAESPADFIHKYSLALKEANESDYWIELEFQAGNLSEQQFGELRSQNEELIRMLVASIKTRKRNSAYSR